MNATDAKPINALSFDIEDWFHLVGIDSVANRDRWPALESLVQRYTEWIVETVTEAKVKATFFMLGWVAERHPQIVRLIADHGHELGTHSYWHRKVCDLDAAAFREDIHKSIDAISSASGAAVTGFRAPSFSITPGAEWAFDVLREAGLQYDASLFPGTRNDGGYLCPPGPHVMTNTPSGIGLPELPMSVLKLGPVRLPFSGGGYMRLLPSSIIRACFNRFHRQGLPVVVYLHPRDFAPDCPRVPMPPHRRFKCYVGLDTTKEKLRMLLATYRFGTCAKVLGLDGA